MSRISVSSSRIARSVSSRWACSSSTCSRASSYSRSASGLTGPIWARRRSSRSQPAVDLGPLLLAQRLLGRAAPPRRGARRSRPAPAPPRRGGRRGGRPRPRPWSARPTASFISACSSNSRCEQARISSAISSPSPSLADHGALGPLDPGADRGAGRLDRRDRGADVVEQLLAGRQPAGAAPRGGARPAGPRRGARGAAARSAPPRTAAERRLAGRLGGLGRAGAERGRRRRSPARRRSRPAPPPVCAPARAGAPPATPTSRVSGPSSARSASRPRPSSASRPARPAARTATRSCSPRSLVSRPQAWVRSRSRAAKRSSAARRRSLTSASRSSSLGPLRPRLRRPPRRRGARSAPKRSSSETKPPPQRQLLALDPRPQLGRLRLALQRPQPGAGLALDVERPVEVVAGGAQLQLGPAAALAVLAEARRLLDQEAPLARLGVDDRLDPALADHRVHLAAEVGVGEDLDDVGQAAAGAVEPVAALAGAVEAALHRDLGELGRGAALGVVDHHLDLGRAALADALAARPRSRPASRRRGSPPGSARRAPTAPRR